MSLTAGPAFAGRVFDVVPTLSGSREHGADEDEDEEDSEELLPAWLARLMRKKTPVDDDAVVGDCDAIVLSCTDAANASCSIYSPAHAEPLPARTYFKPVRPQRVPPTTNHR